MSAQEGLFGRVRLGYLLVESQRLDEWQRFAADGIGMHVDRFGPDVLALRIDSHERRVVVSRGPAEDVAALGWQLDDDTILRLALERLQRLRVEVTEVADERAALRGVERYWSFVGPKGLASELFFAPRLSSRSLEMRASGFMTGAGGMGHVAISTREPEAMLEFWRSLFDARISDRIEERLDGVQMDLTFLRFNERHHTMATAATRGRRMNPLRTQIHHLNFEAARLDDVTEAYLRCREIGYPMANGIGQHPNDRELSFYVVSPSGFEVELGWNPIRVDERNWQPTVHHGISLWGHRPENLTTRIRLGRMVRALTSLARPEHVAGVE
jgi:2,3-dihydroxybiphenyl 1,2-dioxygenase